MRISFEKIWFLDAFGHLIAYAPYRRDWCRIPIPGLLPGGFVISPYPMPASLPLVLWGHVGGKVDTPDFEMEGEKGNFIALYKKEDKKYLSINIHSMQTALVDRVDAWERFLPITSDMFQGLIMMINPTVGEMVLFESGEKIQRVAFPPPGAVETHTILLNNIRVSLADNRFLLAALGRLAVGETDRFVFSCYDSNEHCILDVTRLKPLAEKG